jgi:tetratricopeptide (TPR) repeat protein
MDPQSQAWLNEAFEARRLGDWDRVLDLLRQSRAHIDPALVSYLRGSIWLEAGDAATAALFYEHAFKLQPENVNYRAGLLNALKLADPAAARELLREHVDGSPAPLASTF